MGILDMLQTSPSGGKGGGIVERARETYNPNRYDGVQLGMIGGVKPGGGYWQGLDGNGLAHASDPSYEDYSQRFREFSFAEKPGWVPVGQRDGRTVYAAPDYVKTDGVYDMFSAGEATKYAGTHGLLLPTRDEVKSFYDQATHIPMPTQNIGAMGGPGDAAAYTAAIGDVQGPVVHGKEWYVAGDQNASAAPSGNHPAYSIVRGFEGYRDTPYWDVNAYRTGYGSDTVTMADGTVVPVRQGMTINRADAERDLKRRVDTEFMPAARDAIGADAWDKLTPAQQGVLTSLTYNYGTGAWGSSLSRVAEAVRSGSPADVANAIQSLGVHNDGINQGRRTKEASIYMGGDIPSEVMMASNNPGQQIADDTMRALGMDPTQQQPQPRGVMDFLKGTETGGERSYLGGWLTPDRRDNLIMALQGMTLNPNAAMINAASDRISSREDKRAGTAAEKKQQQQTNRTIAFLRAQNRNDLANAVEAGLLDSKSAATMLFQEQGGKPATPHTDPGKLFADFQNGLITREQYDQGIAALGAGGSGLDTKERLDAEANVRNRLTTDLGEYEQRKAGQQIIESAATGKAGVSDVALVNAFAKVLDPTSVVRESEFAAIANSGGLGDSLKQTLLNTLNNEQALPPGVREEIIRLSTDIFNRAGDQAQTTYQNAADMATRENLNPKNIYFGEQPYTIEGRSSGLPLSQMRPQPRPGGAPVASGPITREAYAAALAKMDAQELLEFTKLPAEQQLGYLAQKGYLQ